MHTDSWGGALSCRSEELVDGQLAESNGRAEERRGSALYVGLDHLWNVNADELVALRRVGAEEVAELREEECDLSLGLSVAQPGFVGGEDPLAQLAFGAGGTSLEERVEGMVENVLMSTSSEELLSQLAVAELCAHAGGRSASGEHGGDARTADELVAHGVGGAVGD